MNKLFRHKKRGGLYELLGEAEAQVSKPTVDVMTSGAHVPLREGDRLAIYRGGDGRLWARPAAEFHDGRFEDVTPARRWWADEYTDECMPTGTFSPDDWIIGALGCDWLIGPADRGECRDYGCYILQPGVEIGFTWHEDRGRAELTVFGDGTWRLDRPEPQDWTTVYDRDAPESISDSLDDFARTAVSMENLRPDDAPLVYDVGFAKWGHALFRLEQTADREARFVPVDAERAEGSGNG